MLIACVAAMCGVPAQGRDIAPLRAVEPSDAPSGEREILHYRVQGDGVTTEFVSVDTSYCDLGVETITIVHAARGVIDTNGDVTESSLVSVIATVYDRCAQLPLMIAIGSGPVEDLHVSPNRKSASLRASFEGRDGIYGDPVLIAVDLVWNGVGQPDRTTDHVRYDTGTQHFVSNSTGTIRSAVASGTVTVGGRDVSSLPSIYGVIESDATRTLSLYR